MTITVPSVRPQAAEIPYNQGAGSARPFGSGAAVAQYNLGGQVAQSGDVLGEYEARKQGLKRDDLHQNAIASLNDFYRKMQATGDFSDKAVAEAKAHGEKTIADALSQYDGGDVTTQALRQNLEGAKQSFDDQVAVGNLNYTDRQMNNRIGQKISGTVAAAQSDPSILDQNATPYAFVQKHMGSFENQLAQLGVSPAQMQSIAPVAEQEVIRASVSQLIRAGQFDKARAYMADPQLIEAMQPATRTEIGERIINAESEANKGRIEGQVKLDEIATVMGLPTNDPRVHQAAALAMGLVKDKKYEMTKLGEGAAVIWDPNTGQTISRLEPEKGNGPDSKLLPDVDRLRSQYLQQSTDFSQISDAKHRLVAGAKQYVKNPKDGGAFDILLMNTFMKIVDPGGRVVDTDIGHIVQSSTLSDTIKTTIQHVLNGASLSAAQRNSFLNEALAAYDAQKGIQQVKTDKFRNIAKEQLPGFNPDNVIPDFSSEEDVKPVQLGIEKLDENSDLNKALKTQVENITKTGGNILGVPANSVEDHLKNAEQHIGALQEHLPSVDEINKMSRYSLGLMLHSLLPGNLQDHAEELRKLKEDAPNLWKALIDKYFSSEEEKK